MFEIGKIYDFCGFRRKVIDYSGDYPVTTTEFEEDKFVCQYCGKECASQLGLSSHERNCKAKEVE